MATEIMATMVTVGGGIGSMEREEILNQIAEISGEITAINVQLHDMIYDKVMFDELKFQRDELIEYRWGLYKQLEDADRG